MSKISNKISYLKGLVEGKSIADKSEEGKILIELIDVITDVVEKVDQIEERLADVEDFKDTLDDEMQIADDMLSHFFRDYVDEEDGDFLDVEIEDEDDDDVYEVTCNECGNTYMVTFDDFIDDNVVCPECGKVYDLADDIINRLIEGEHNHD